MKLMRRFRDRDPDAVRELYESYGRAVFTIAYRALSDRGLAEEAVQLTFLQAWRAADRFDPEAPAEDLALAQGLVDWCEVTGGLPTSG